ncbi:helix-turn-helix domain-containing protein [Bacteroides sp. 51]|uniref:helix-turn-helix domain-containing protein n=1 Tax=Bacteroides sp. 51 TaxID=2302938 RepID=UPI0013D40CE2|nr:helix-turn-helix transcriptional regulator [Bacteroides sp. 51]NDV82225.1 XRE family transcriptional regulator [Bacteroides sp. 51]
MELRIKEVSKGKGVTIVSLAEMIGVAQPTMSNLANGKTTPSLETLEKIANALNVPVTELFEKPKTDTASLSCPHCGKSIMIKAE